MNWFQAYVLAAVCIGAAVLLAIAAAIWLAFALLRLAYRAARRRRDARLDRHVQAALHRLPPASRPDVTVLLPHYEPPTRAIHLGDRPLPDAYINREDQYR